MELVLPSVVYKDSYIDAVREFQADSTTMQMENGFNKLSVAELETNFEAYLERKRGESEGKGLPEGFVPATMYWLVESDEYIGTLNIRHHLNKNLEKIGGHIGYSIRPSQRQKGYGTQILALGLQKAKEIGITRALVTCDITNLASRKIIEKNGGVLENQVSNPETGIDKLRFWIDIA